MKIKKSCYETGLRSEDYGNPNGIRTCFLVAEEDNEKPARTSSLETLSALFKEAKKDFPALTEGDTAIMQWGNLNHEGAQVLWPVYFNAIAFNVAKQPPAEYKDDVSSYCFMAMRHAKPVL